MNILVVIALIVAASVCFIPGIMAWNHYFGGKKQVERKNKTAEVSRPVTTGHVVH